MFTISSAECNKHPNHLFLFFQVACQHIGCYRIVGFVCQVDELSFFGDEVLVCVQNVVYGFVATCYTRDFRYTCHLKISAVLVLWCTAQSQYSFCKFVYLGCRIIVHAFELLVKYKESTSLDFPMEATQIGIIYLEIG